MFKIYFKVQITLHLFFLYSTNSTLCNFLQGKNLLSLYFEISAHLILIFLKYLKMFLLLNYWHSCHYLLFLFICFYNITLPQQYFFFWGINKKKKFKLQIKRDSLHNNKVSYIYQNVALNKYRIVLSKLYLTCLVKLCN